MSENHFIKLAGIDVNGKTEKKNNLTYLSWAWAVDQLLRQDGSATWAYGEPARWGETFMVFCTVTAFGKAMTAQLPVMNHKNQAIANPDAFAVNTAMQRCLAKAIGLHGIGLYIYAGEDMPMEGDETRTSTRTREPQHATSNGHAAPTDGASYPYEKPNPIPMTASPLEKERNAGLYWKRCIFAQMPLTLKVNQEASKQALMAFKSAIPDNWEWADAMLAAEQEDVATLEELMMYANGLPKRTVAA